MALVDSGEQHVLQKSLYLLLFNITRCLLLVTQTYQQFQLTSMHAKLQKTTELTINFQLKGILEQLSGQLQRSTQP